MKNNKKFIITFEHYKTGEQMKRLCSELPQYNKQPSSEVLVVYNHGEERIEPIYKTSIIEMKETT